MEDAEFARTVTEVMNMSLMSDAYIGLIEELTSDPDEQDYLYEHPEILEDLEKRI